MVWPDATAGPFPWLRTSLLSFAGADPPGTLRVGFCPNAPVTFTPELAEELDADPDADDLGDEPPQAARAGVASRPAASTNAACRAEGRRKDEADSFTRNLRLLGAVDPITVRVESERILHVSVVLPMRRVIGAPSAE